MMDGVRILCAALLAAFVCISRAGAGAEPNPARKQRWDSLEVRNEHPRIWLDGAKIAWLKAKTKGMSAVEVRELAGSAAEGLALTYVITGDEATGRQAVEKAKADMASSRGRAVVPLALCYDWCYPLLSEDEKTSIRADIAERARQDIAFARVWRSFHNGLYSTGWRVCAAALAIYWDDPYGKEAMDFLKGEFEDALKTFENLFPDGEWPESFDYNRHVTYDALRFFTAIKSATGADFLKDSAHIRNTTLFILYASKPDGLVLNGDDNDWPFVGVWEREALLILASQYRDRYAQYYLNHCPAENFAFNSSRNWIDLLWYDASIPEKSPADLPPSRIFRGDGLVIARSGWDWDAKDKPSGTTWMTFRCGNYYGDHAHYDNGHFDIYYRGALAIDSGRYDDDWGLERGEDMRARSQFFNYYQRTIAHNTILVYDPDEKMQMDVVNDGGQKELLLIDGVRNVPEDYEQGTFPSDDGAGTCDWATNPGRWDTGKMLAYVGTPDFTYACGDATKAYGDHKMRQFVRQMVFIQPDMFVVFDRVAATKAAFKKTWLLHSVEEPKVAADGSWYEIAHRGGRVVTVPLLPAKRKAEKIGGPGNEFLVGGVHYKCGPESMGRPSELHYGETPGAWRIEESPAEGAEEDFFLHVMLVTDRNDKSLPKVEVLEDGPGAVKIGLASPSGAAAQVGFAKKGAPSAALRLEKKGKVVYEGDLPDRIVLEEGRPE